MKSHIEPTREPERYAMVWPGIPPGLTKDQAKNFFVEHRKPRTYVMERFTYNPLTGHFSSFGFDKVSR